MVEVLGALVRAAGVRGRGLPVGCAGMVEVRGDGGVVCAALAEAWGETDSPDNTLLALHAVFTIATARPCHIMLASFWE